MVQPNVPFASYLDFAVAHPRTRLSIVKRILNRAPYDPQTDYWRILRRQIVGGESDGSAPDSLTRVADSVHEKKRENYRKAIRGYKRWRKRQPVSLISRPEAKDWDESGAVIRVNPEMQMSISGEPTLVKLYFKAEPLSSRRLNAALTLLYSSAQKRSRPPRSAILDVQRGRLFVAEQPIDDELLMLGADLDYFVSLWSRLGG